LFRDRLFLKQPHGFFESDSPFDGKKCLVSYAALKQHPLLVAVTLDKEALLSDWEFKSLRMATMALIVSVLVLLSMFALVELIRRQENIAAEVRENEQRLRLITDNMNDVVWTADADMHLTYVSPSVERLRGFTVEEAIKQTPGQILVYSSFREIRAKMQEMFDAAARGEVHSGLDARFEVEQNCKNGTTIWMEESVRFFFDADGKFLGMQGVARPICERKRLEDELRLLANTDTLTGLANRRTFLGKLEQEVARAHRYGHSLSILMLDIDHFKVINDRYGHPAGDEALRRFAGVCQAVLRRNDVMARMGGEEFAAFLPETGLDGACLIGERLRQAVEELVVVYGDEYFHFTTSIGIVLLRGQDDGEYALKLADKALYLAKTSGRNRVVVHQESPIPPSQPTLI
jgi:diguanylate cyclase (GGDEF)-like protein/PAS domain S-box-containing protein